MSTTRIPPTPADPTPNPPSGGHWLRDTDGGLSPADAATAAGAGLDWPADSSPITPFTE